MNKLDELKQRVVKTRLAYQVAKQAYNEATKNAFAIRVCRNCKKQITVSHKWHFVTVKDVTMTEHRTCKYPDSYNDEQGKRLHP